MSTFGSVFELSSLDGSNGFQINGEAVGDRSGGSVASAGDVNGDGFDDLIIGASSADPNGYSSGASYVVFGTGKFAADLNLTRLNGTNGFRINGEDVGDHSGGSVASAGDVNGDGIDDLIIGAYGSDSNGPSGAGYGAAYVVFGAAGRSAATLNLSTLNGTNGFQILGEVTGDLFGRSVASAGDVNGDGFDDLIIGAYRAEANANLSGVSYVVFGAEAGFTANLNLSALNGTNGFQINGEAAYDFSGGSVASAGDVNGDGYDDLIIGASDADPNGNYSGASYVVFGAADGFAANLDLSTLNGANGFQINGETAGDHSGVSVGSAGDVNGDGFNDLIIGAYWSDPNGFSSGASYVVFGTAGAFAANLELSSLDGNMGFQINGEAAHDVSGHAVASAGDVNGDGFDDLIIGAWGADPHGIESGASYVVFGAAGGFAANLNLSTLNGSNGFQINGEVARDTSGRSVASAGDINGDGFDDLIIGATGADPNGNNTGASYVIFGKATRATAGNDKLTGHEGAETLSGLDGSDTLYGMGGADQLTGDAGNDVLYGGAGNDIMIDGAGDDIMYGGAGHDIFVLDSANDLVFDASGSDEVIANFSIDLSRVDYMDIENASLTGTANTSLTGSAADNVLTGNAGDNSISGGVGNDHLDGGAGNDIMYGGAGNDVYIFDSPNDSAFDTGGLDEVRATFSVNLTSTAFAMMENAALLGTGNVNLTGGVGANQLTGNAGRNILLGGAGSDTIVGGAGNDTIAGGAGRDVFEFISMRDMTTRDKTTDVITDFRRGQDKIDLSDIDASTVRPTDDAFLFRGKAAIGTNTAGEVSYKQFDLAGKKNDYTLVYLDTDGDRAAEGVIKVMGLHSFTAGDFIL